MSRILLTGGSGQVGKAVKALVWPPGMSIIAPDRSELDLADQASIASYLSRQRFDLIINAAAYTAVDRAESEPDLAHAVNGIAPQRLASRAALDDIPFLHLSTDYVFNGSKSLPYGEDDATDPVSIYGLTKREGERAVQMSCPRHVILRTSWIISLEGRNFVTTVLRLARERGFLRIVDDQHGAPTVAADLAGAIQKIALRQLADVHAPSGLYHCTNAGETTWFGLADALFTLTGAKGFKVPALQAITTAEYPTPARRPANSRLDNSKLARDFVIALRHWTQALDTMLEPMLAGAASDDATTGEPQS